MHAGNPVGFSLPAEFAQLPLLSLEARELGWTSIPLWFAQWPQLQSLALTDNALSLASVLESPLPALMRNHSLRWLSLGGNPLGMGSVTQQLAAATGAQCDGRFPFEGVVCGVGCPDGQAEFGTAPGVRSVTSEAAVSALC